MTRDTIILKRLSSSKKIEELAEGVSTLKQIESLASGRVDLRELGGKGVDLRDTHATHLAYMIFVVYYSCYNA